MTEEQRNEMVACTIRVKSWLNDAEGSPMCAELLAEETGDAVEQVALVLDILFYAGFLVKSELGYRLK